MKKTLHLFVALMCLLNTIPAMEIPPSPQPYKSNLDASNIDFESLINATEKERIEIHFFWTTGRPYELLKDEYGADRNVDIGGSSWAGKFNSFIFDFLYFVPPCVHVVFVCDRLTSESNSFLFADLNAKFGKRFKLVPWEKLTTEIYNHLFFSGGIYDIFTQSKFNLGQFYDILLEEMYSYESNLKRFFDQGFCGNPAISSDSYRLIAMPLACGKTGVAFEKIMWSYTDVDAFCYALEHKNMDNYLKALLETQKGTFSYKPPKNNDVIKLGFDHVDSYREYARSVLDHLTLRYRMYCDYNDLHVMNYLDSLFTYLQKNDFEGYMTAYAEDIDNGLERIIIQLTGPDLAKDLGMSPSLKIPRTFTLEWNPSENITYCGPDPDQISYTSHINNCGDGEYMAYLMDQYMPHLRRALALKRFGAQHPFNVKLLNWLRDNNPYLSRGYRMYIEEYKGIFEEVFFAFNNEENCLSFDNEDLKQKFLKEEINYSTHHPGSARIPVFYRFRAALRSLGVEFPIVPEDDIVV